MLLTTTEVSRSSRIVPGSRWDRLTEAQRERRKETTREWKALNRDKVSANKRQWDLANTDRKREHDKKYAARHSAKLSAYKAKWHAELWDMPTRRLHLIARVALKRGAKRGLVCDAALPDVFSTNVPTTCAACARSFTFATGPGTHRLPTNPSIDRINNSLGYTIANTAVICHRCNRIKSDATLEEMRALTAYMERGHAVSKH